MRLFDLKVTQLAALLFVHHKCSDEGAQGVPCTELAKTLGLSTAAITGMKDKLVGFNLLEECRDPSDRRVTLLRLTSEGATIVLRFSNMDLTQPYRALLSLLQTDG